VAGPSDPVEHRATVRALRMTAERVLAARLEATQLEAELRERITVVAPALLDQRGVGPISAAPGVDQLVALWPVPLARPRLRCWAALHRWRPPPARSSAIGPDRGGDRQRNRALHTIVMIRQTHHGPTQASTTRRIAEGKSQRDIRRCRKRTVARQLYRLLERTTTDQATT
jgi:transposase